MMNIRSVSLISCLIILNFAAVSAQEVLGRWKTIDDETGKAKSIVRVYQAKNGKVYGKIEKLLDLSQGENPICEKCPGDRKNQPVVGMTIIRGLSLKGDTWQGGKILDPEKGKEYTCKIWLEEGKLKVRGYWGLFYRTQTWYRAS